MKSNGLARATIVPLAHTLHNRILLPLAAGGAAFMRGEKFISETARFVYLGLGWFFFGVGALGAFLPVLPTTPFMILALWAFTNGSERLRAWLYNHRVFGMSLQRWHEHRVIPASAKMASVGAMSVSFAYLLFFRDLAWPWLAATGALMAYGAYFILTKPSRIP